MNSLVKVFSNFKDFYSEINGATLTGAIDVIVVEQPDGTFLCSPFHVRFGKMGVLRSRQKIVDIEVNGEPVDIHMKLGESGEAFFVEECAEEELAHLPANMATSPLPTGEFVKYADSELFEITTVDEDIDLPRPRRNSIDFFKETEEVVEKKFDNQVSDFSQRRHTDTMERRNLTAAKKEYTTQKIRQEWAEHEEQMLGLESTVEEARTANDEEATDKSATADSSTEQTAAVNAVVAQPEPVAEEAEIKTEETKSKKKRRKKSIMKKKAMQRKCSSSSSDLQSEVVTLPADDSSNDSSPKAGEWNDVNASGSLLEKAEASVLNDNTEAAFPVSTTDDATLNHSLNDSVDPELMTKPAATIDDKPVAPSTLSAEGSPIQSDNEIDIMSNSASWKWGELPTHGEDTKETAIEFAKQAQRNSMLSNMFGFMKQSKAAQLDGVYLSDLDTEGMDPEVAALYFPQINKSDRPMRLATGNTTEDDRESGKGTSLPNSPSLMDSLKALDSDYDEDKSADSKCLDFVAMSLCGGIENGSGPTEEQFDRNVIPYHEVCQNPSIFSSPLLVVRLNGKYFSWAAACPIVMTIIAYQKPLSNEAIEQLMQVHKIAPATEIVQAKEQQSRGYSSWWTWRRSGSGEKREVVKSASKEQFDPSMGAGEKGTEPNHVGTQVVGSDTSSDAKPPSALANGTNDAVLELSDDGQSGELYRKSLRLTTSQIESLNLKNGMNEISFSVTTAYQGTSRCKCYLFRWRHDDKVVISDIDGTITKSDVLGHILPMVGRDWAQIGVAQLFSKIEENGYKLLYLSARAIGQSRATREYLRSIRQGDVKLPDGPLLLNPTSLISALHREVIEKKPEQFKIACLSDIRDLFPERNAFYAGYGNRINDVWAYRAVGIPIMRIFTINPKGELKHELTQTFQSSYCNMTYIADQLFPPINTIEESVEFSNFNYWREPVLELDDFKLTTSGDTAAHDASTQTPSVRGVSPPLGDAKPLSPTSAKNLPSIPEHRKV